MNTAFPKLAVLPSLTARFIGNEQVRLTQKFADGMAEYAALWPGKVIAIMHPDDKASSGNMDDRIFDLSELPYDVCTASFGSASLFQALADADVVMFGSDHRLPKLAQWCSDNGKKSVFVAEYTLQTRRQIIRAESSNPFLQLRRFLWEWQQEKRNRRNVTLADAVQCNGIPIYLDYAALNTNTLLYLDNRVTAEMQADSATISARSEHLHSGGPIRLAYSGRLDSMKGADDLVEVAKHLSDVGLPFRMDIFGDGSLKNMMAEKIQAYSLDSSVQLNGVLDFSSELMPRMRNSVDLFVCCHRQGDPSCTYVETLSCGVPIIGYDNEALQGLIEKDGLGWSSPMNQPKLLAEQIVKLHANPDELYKKAESSLNFGQQHSFEKEFRARIEQITKLIS